MPVNITWDRFWKGGFVSSMGPITDIRQLTELAPATGEKLQAVTDKYVFRLSEYYRALINWDDPEDPIRHIVIPNLTELDEYGRLDPSDEAENYAVPGCQHKYGPTALLLVSEVCAAYCRFCFRKRLFKADVHEAALDVSAGIDYIARHPEINNVLLTGGDPLMLSVRRLDDILRRLRALTHVGIIRIGSKVPAFDPGRIVGNSALLNTLGRYSRSDARIYVMAHFNHPRELTPQALAAVDSLQRAGVAVANQTPILRKINADADVLGELLNGLAAAGVTPYYIFQNRPVAGNADFVVPLAQAYEIVEGAKTRTSGLGKRVKFIMSHASGKIEVLAVTDGKIHLKYHQARKPTDLGRYMVFDLPSGAAWFDDLTGL